VSRTWDGDRVWVSEKREKERRRKDREREKEEKKREKKGERKASTGSGFVVSVVRKLSSIAAIFWITGDL
jgi:hypothetical protein